ncbi:hypothetical protein HQ865_01295 [Mucilaginibacter mali]|uniref:NrS-1 polymerase-like helicase domain-containing protein n=1 Tax=Mucilaginibacter mali TaxID=2740462 RepID=A0A7D4QHK8_9SPHI|nr:DUF5906 domain-containing protein [Mucilaginibacter mali]QKJ28450.1 hypothetical protein HQ865_01295 [Mucilaginibacter mali]
MAKKQHKKTEAIDATQLDTYFKQRMHHLGITNTADHVITYENLEYPGVYAAQPIFSETERGDIVINYPCLYGGLEYITDTEKPFTRLRIHPDHTQRDGFGRAIKYLSEKGSGVHIFHPPLILKKFADKEKIKTLYVVEGEFKAFAGAALDIDMVGIAGIQMFASADKRLHEDIVAILNTCQVEHLVLLMDADVHHLEWDADLEPNKDLSKRLFDFFTAVRRFKELALDHVKDIYFMHLSQDNMPDNKGLDDLIFSIRNQTPERLPELVTDLLTLAARKPGRLFVGHKIRELGPDKIKALFFLDFHKRVPQSFYNRYDHIIDDRQFTFYKGRYQNKPTNGLELVRHQDADSFMRIGTDYVKVIYVPDAKKIMRRKLKGWTSGELSRDYEKNGVPGFFQMIPRYDEYCNVPCNDDGYEQVIGSCYNMYFKLTHQLSEGAWPTIKAYLKHAFGEAVLSSGHTNYDLALDYLNILYRIPTQRLPIPALVNRKRGTGKSTFLFLVKEMLQENAAFISSEDLKDQFNSDWVPKAAILIDEGFIEKKATLEKLKSYSTAHTINLRMMHVGRQEIPFFGKFILTSNDEDNFAGIDDEEVRFWVNKVPVLTEEDPDLLDKMKAELPHFLYYLSTREALHPKRTRSWFSNDLIDTEAGQRVKKASRGWLYSELETILQESFVKYQYHTLHYTIGELVELLNNRNAAVKFRQADVKKQMFDKFHQEAKLMRYYFPTDPAGRNNLLPDLEQKLGRVYRFFITDFYSDAELRTLCEGEDAIFDYPKLIAMKATDSELPKDAFNDPFNPDNN